jgi:ATP-dependent Clp protease ATP-binding subunit ClpX
MVRIIKEPKNSLIRQYQTLFAMDDVELEVDEDAVQAIAEKALALNTGARGLRGIFEGLMTDLMYEIPSQDDVVKVIITGDVVRNGADPVIIRKGDKKAISSGDAEHEVSRVKKNDRAAQKEEKEA